MSMLTRISFVLALLLALPIAQARDQLRPEVGKPLQEAQALMKKGRNRDALAQIDAAGKVGKLTDYERFVIAQMRGAALSAAGDSLGAASAFEQVLAAKRLSAAEQLNITEALAGTYLRAKRYPDAIKWMRSYREQGGTKPAILAYLPQAHFHAGDYATAAREAAALVAQQEKAGQSPDENLLKVLAASQAKAGDMDGYSQALERLVRYHPRPEYWDDAINRTAAKPGFSRALELDKLRLLRATGNLKSAQAYSEMAQLALQDNLPGEAKAIVDEGTQKKILGQGDAREVEREGRLKKLIAERIAEDRRTMGAADAEIARSASGEPMLAQGLAYVTHGDAGKGLAMMQAGIDKGGLKSPQHALLHLGYANYLAGNKAAADAAFKQVQGEDGARDLARLWRVFMLH